MKQFSMLFVVNEMQVKIMRVLFHSKRTLLLIRFIFENEHETQRTRESLKKKKKKKGELDL